MKNLRTKKSNKKGFTLIELIVVIAILAILALILVPTISNYVTEANNAKNFANARSVMSEANAYAAMNSDETDCTDVGLTVPDDATLTTCTMQEGALTAFTLTISGDAYTFDKDTGQLSDPNAEE